MKKLWSWNSGLFRHSYRLGKSELPRAKQPSVAKNLGYLISCQHSDLGNICIVQQPKGILREYSDENVRLWSGVRVVFFIRFISSLIVAHE